MTDKQELQTRWRYIIEGKHQQLAAITERNNKLDDRADRIIHTGGVFIGLLTVAQLPIEWGLAWPANLPTLLTLFGFAAFLGAILFHLRRFRPLEWQIPGTSAIEEIFTDYLESEVFYNQLLSDLVNGVKSAEGINAYKATGVKVLSWLLLVQVLVVTTAWLLGHA